VIVHLAAWIGHPVTLALAGLVAATLFVVIEVLLRSLAAMGNVRFQGILDDHPRLLRSSGESGLHLSLVTEVLRWLLIASVGLLWLIIFTYPGVGRILALALSVLLPVVLVAASRRAFGVVDEEAVAVLLRVVRPLAWPVIVLLPRVEPEPQVAPSEDEEEEASEREIQAYLEAGHAAGIFEIEEGEFVESLVDFFDTVVREVMTPRTEMVAVPDTASSQEVLEAFASSHKSRIPVYHETVDRIVGVVHVKRLVEHLMGGELPPVDRLVSEPMIVPENKDLGELLRDFQKQHQQMAIVVDEYGGTSGLVTLEDILEEIVGEIQDEHDPKAPPEWQEIGPGEFRLQGRASLEVLEELFGVEVVTEDVDTVGGLVFSQHGTVPEPGTEVALEAFGLHFTVEEMQERRVVSVIVRRAGGTDPKPE